jgi:hypothetical protein
MVIEWISEWFDRGLASTFLDDLLDEIASTDVLERRTILWAEVVRRFNQDVERACRVARVSHPREEAAKILDAALRWVGSEPAKYFSRELVRLMRGRLGTAATDRTIRMLYLRQLVTEVPHGLIRYANAFLDNEMEMNRTAETLNEDPALVERRVREFWKALREVVPKEFSDVDLSDRTDGVWTYLKLRSE